MKKQIQICRRYRFVSLVCLTVDIPILIWICHLPPLLSVTEAVMTASMIIGLSFAAESFGVITLLTATFLIVFIPFSSPRVAVWCFILMTSLLMIAMLVGRVLQMKTYFDKGAVERSLMVEANSVYFVSYILVTYTSYELVCWTSSMTSDVVAFTLSTFNYMLLYARSRSSRPYLHFRKCQECILTMARGSLRPSPSMPQISGDKSTEMYAQLQFLMQEKKLFLNPDLTELDLILALGTNRTYFSQMINENSGLDFRQYVNHYRVMHAARLIYSGEKLKMSEIAMMSGFSSVPCFNDAFRRHMKMRPKDYKASPFQV